jgi:hypothetical protein
MMFQFQFRCCQSCTRLLPLLVFILWTFFIVAGVFAEESLTPAHQKTAIARADAESAGASSNEPAAHAVSLFTLHNGVCTPEYFSRHELKQGRPLEIQGSVVGVVVFGPDDLKVELGGQKLRPIQSDADGTFHVKGYGKFNPSELSARTHMARGGQGLPTATIAPPPGATGRAFYYFPKVFGAAVSSQQQFELQLAGQDSRQVVEINHRPIQKIAWADGRKVPSSSFYYVGHRLETLLETAYDFQGRLAAIYDGVRLVEDAFQLDLVQDVQLIDLNRRNNALTYEGRNTIWFYVDTVLGTSAQELRRIASHEALHQLVYQLRLAHHSQTRRFFADLWNLDKLSMARFQMVTSGWFDSRSAQLTPSNRLFFSFINEKNFMRGMNGGHSHDNLDEFLTSFIHSLLYIEKLERNLHSPVSIYGTKTRHRLTDQEKTHILNLYKQSIELLIQTTEASSPQDPVDQHKADFNAFLRERLAYMEQTAPSSPILVQGHAKTSDRASQ